MNIRKKPDTPEERERFQLMLMYAEVQESNSGDRLLRLAQEYGKLNTRDDLEAMRTFVDLAFAYRLQLDDVLPFFELLKRSTCTRERRS
ncbi:hypothetical protein BGZ93_006627 [Podila epicladia]|nr:hypothetical protein BGZ92_004564 [Podila epicladia]KAG0099642.1 hypothetical protein BGZ93_006627 [Podila epicladia]